MVGTKTGKISPAKFCVAMTRRILVLPEAEYDIEDIYNYIAETNHDRAMQFFDAARQTFAELARIPGLGQIYISDEDDISDLYRWFIKGFRNHLIFYRFSNEILTIVRVIDGRRDLQSILEDFL